MIGPNKDLDLFNDKFEVEILEDTESEFLPSPDENFLIFSEVVDKMIKLEELFRLSMEPKNLLEIYLQKNEDDYAKMNKFSANMREYLVSDTSVKRKKSDARLKRFLLAFAELIPTQGYSMIKCLKSNEPLGDFLSCKIDKLFPIYERFLEFKSICLNKENLASEENHRKKRKAPASTAIS